MHRLLTPPGWPRGKGYSHGVAAFGQMVFVSGQIGWDEEGRLKKGFVAQLRKALENTVAVLAAGGAAPRHVVRMTWYVVDKREYLDNLAEAGSAYREVMGKHFPAMTVIEVKGLVEEAARLEIETTAVIPSPRHPNDPDEDIDNEEGD